MNEKFCNLITIPLNFVPKDLIYNKLALVQVMAGCRTDDKPLTTPMLTQLTDAALGGAELTWAVQCPMRPFWKIIIPM